MVGSVRDTWVSGLATFVAGFACLAAAHAADREGGSIAAKPKDASISQLIDREIDAKLTKLKVAAAAPADDAEFLRRVSLDLVGVIPSSEKARAFLKDTDPKKREKLIDELLASPRFGLHLADQWESLLMVRDSTNRRLKSKPLYDWLADRFNKNSPWDKTVHDLMTATGTQEENGAATFFIALRTPEKLTDQTTRLFLGVQLQCAQCHDHPFARWKRDDYWSMAAFFSKVRAGGKKVGLAKNGVESVNESGQGKKAPDPDSSLKLAPKFLGADRPDLKKTEPFRPALAKWMCSPTNPYFAKAMVNRTWAQFFGRGLVNPVDDISDRSEPSHPELFDSLAKNFAAGGFDLKALIRGICNSRAYQRAGDPADKSSAGDDLNFARMAVKPLTPEQLYDSLASVLGTLNEDREVRKGAKAPPTTTRAKFVEFFDVPDSATATEYATGIPQVLQLMNAAQFNRGAKLIDEIAAAGLPHIQAIERIYLAVLSRRPTEAETAKLVAFIESDKQNPKAAYTDILWVLLNSSEFALNH